MFSSVISNLMCVWTRDLQNFFVIQRQKCNDKKFNLKILICFNSLVTKHPIPLSNWTIFVLLKHYVEDYKCSLSFKNRRTMCEDSTSFEFLINVHLLTYLI